MAINKSKKLQDIIDVSKDTDPLRSENMKQNSIERKQIPFSTEDTLLHKNQQVFDSINDILYKLKMNDLFSENYVDKSGGYITDEKNQIIKNAFNYDQQNGGYPPENNNIYETYYQNHFKEYHQDAECSLAYVKKTYMDVDCSNLDSKNARRHFTKTYPENHELPETDNLLLQNDILLKTEFGDDDTLETHNNYITVSICNKHTDGKFRQTIGTSYEAHRSIPSTTSTAYIFNEWLSGLKELYIYVPTTFTFYNDCVDGENITDNTTFIRVIINKRHFKLNHIYNVEICGTSLPLQIHTENISYFNDVIEPSLLRTMCVSNSIENNTYCIYNNRTSTYTLYFMCYGTDEQSIRIYCD